MKECDCTCKYFESVHAEIKLSNGTELPMYLPICKKFCSSLAIIRCQHYQMR